MTSLPAVDTPRVADLLARAASAFAAARFAEAERDVAGVLALAPENTFALRLLAALLHRRGRHRDAIAAIHRALQYAAGDALLHNSLGIALEAVADRQAAISAFRRAVELAPENAALAANLGKSLVDADALDEGAAILETVLARSPAMTPSRFTLAYAHRARGRLADAESELREILRGTPHDGDAWLALSDLGVAANGSERQRMRDGLADSTVRGRSRIALGFALAHACERSAQYDEAWRLFEEMNREVRRIEPWDAAAESAQSATLLSAFDAARASAPADRGREIVFIVGMPRSGSTLIEQILSSHPDVAAGGETPALTQVLAAESQRRREPLPAWAVHASAEDWERLGRDYLAHTAHARQSRPRSTDKRLGNWRLIGAIRRMLPGARIVMCRRDPLENALGCFVRLFAPGTQRFSYDLADIAAYSRSVDDAARSALLCHAHPFREQHHQALIDDPEKEIRALLAFCDLAFDPGCLRFHETERAIRTQSALQVRQPLHAESSRAAYYGERLDALKRALAASRNASG